MSASVSRAVGSIVHDTVRNGHNRDNRCYRLTCRGIHSAKTQDDAESAIIQKLKSVQGERVSHAIKKSVKNGFISKRMFNVYNDLVKKHCRVFTFPDVVLTLQAYALSKERNFEVYSMLAHRALRLFRGDVDAASAKREDVGEMYNTKSGGDMSYDPERHKNIYKYILASNQLNYTDFELMQLFVEEIKRHFHQYDMKRICDILHALSKLKIQDVDLLDGACEHILRNFSMVRCNHINHLISAYSPRTSGGNHEELLLRLVQYICANVKSMDSISVYNTLVQIGPILQRLSRSGVVQGRQEVSEEAGRPHGLREAAPLSGEHNQHNNEDEHKEYCHLMKNAHGEEHQADAKWRGEHNSSQGNVVERVIPLLFSRVNTCIAFLSLKQLIKLLCAYRELNYFNYTFVYKRLLLFLFSKLKTQHKALPGEYISILEFFTFLPYVDSNMKDIVVIVTGNIPKVLTYNYEHLCRLLHCYKKLNICDDAILTRVDSLVFRNKRHFERVSTVDQLNIFLHVYNQGSGEWDEMLSFLRALIEVKGREHAQESVKNEQVASEGGLSSGSEMENRAPPQRSDPTHNVVITYKYNKAHKCFQEYGKKVSVEGTSTGEGEDPLLHTSQCDEGMVRSLSPSPGSASQVSKGICDYLYVNIANERRGT
ncbi:hypothetical protein AK88_04154 [Plasmodium fragile]|uniref:Uncharacterized protein n=1 Tax=Plasmodium fragile TaxID=5857 RepID=A0A0D9QGV2_PLAFR|nr:uncharacterized protein AK88_04154 [Plasmodium fragile]KJP86183.1 hypothetical protein AK88_04154 [Plasmodium fragile]